MNLFLNLYGSMHKFFERLYFPSFRIRYTNSESKTKARRMFASLYLTFPISMSLFMPLYKYNTLFEDSDLYSYFVITVILISLSFIDYQLYYKTKMRSLFESMITFRSAGEEIFTEGLAIFLNLAIAFALFFTFRSK